MDPNSFSVMAYESAPRAIKESDRLKRLLRTSFDDKETEGSGTIAEAYNSLVTVSATLSKFVLLQHPGVQRFSDLDSLEYELAQLELWILLSTFRR